MESFSEHFLAFLSILSVCMLYFAVASWASSYRLDRWGEQFVHPALQYQNKPGESPGLGPRTRGRNDSFPRNIMWTLHPGFPPESVKSMQPCPPGFFSELRRSPSYSGNLPGEKCPLSAYFLFLWGIPFKISPSRHKKAPRESPGAWWLIYDRQAVRSGLPAAVQYGKIIFSLV
jgi:hypothetical protein